MATIKTSMNGSTITFNVIGVESPLSIDMEDLAESVRQRAMVHGLVQKISDAAALSRDPTTGRPALPADKYAAMEEVVTWLQSGMWNRVRTGKERKATGGFLLQALVELYPQASRDKLVAKLKGWTKAEKLAMESTPAIAKVIARLVGEATGSVDVDSLLEDIG